MTQRHRKRSLAALFILSATLITGGSVQQSSIPRGTVQKRFLAMTGDSASLITIVATDKTYTNGASLPAGTRVRLIGTIRGNTIIANRIDVMS